MSKSSLPSSLSTTSEKGSKVRFNTRSVSERESLPGYSALYFSHRLSTSEKSSPKSLSPGALPIKQLVTVNFVSRVKLSRSGSRNPKKLTFSKIESRGIATRRRDRDRRLPLSPKSHSGAGRTAPPGSPSRRKTSPISLLQRSGAPPPRSDIQNQAHRPT